MTAIHPHWHSSDDEHVIPVRVKQSGKKTDARVSRVSAALVGIMLLLGFAKYSFGGIRNFIGQLTNPTPDITIHLHQDGPDPSPAIVRPGNILRFVNDDAIPHILSSETLPTESGSPFSTPGIYAGNDFFITIPVDALDGMHEYISETNPEFSGQIIIDSSAGTANSSSASIETPVIPSSSAPLLPPSQRSSVTAPLAAGVIAVNPHVVGATSSASKKPNVTAHKPLKNTESGPAVWIAGICAVLAISLTAKRAVRSV